MFIRTDAIIRTRQIDELDALVDKIPDRVREFFETAPRLTKTISEMQVDLQYEPPKPPDDPNGSANSIPWTSFAQRLAFNRTGGFGRGIPTQRAPVGFRIVDSIVVRKNINPRSISVSVESYDPRSNFVLGPIKEGVQGEQQGFLVLRGWKPIAPKITGWKPLLREAAREDARDLIEQLRGRTS